MTTTLFKHSWLSREKQFSAFTNGAYWIFGTNVKKVNLRVLMEQRFVMFIGVRHRTIKH